MSRNAAARVVQILDKHEGELLTSWLDRQLRTPGLRRDLIGEAELREQSREFLRRVRAAAVQSGVDVDAPEWGPVREQLRDLSSQRARQGFSPSETATFVFSLKEPLFDRLRQEIGMDAGALAFPTASRPRSVLWVVVTSWLLLVSCCSIHALNLQPAALGCERPAKQGSTCVYRVDGGSGCARHAAQLRHGSDQRFDFDCLALLDVLQHRCLVCAHALGAGNTALNAHAKTDAEFVGDGFTLVHHLRT